ncbi:MAG: hypothetical protein QXI33_02935 [Candidatus Pacearchaeota archaeon]
MKKINKEESKKGNLDEIRIGRKQIKTISIILTTIIITLLIIGFVFVYYPKQVKANKIDSYKKDVYSSILCQYSCPLKEQEFQNKTQMLPDTECVKQCTLDLQIKKSRYTGIRGTDLGNDELVKDVSKVIDDCRTSSLIGDTFTLDNEKYFPCVTQKLESLKDKYDYLK